MDSASDWAATAALASKTAIVAVRSSWVGTRGGVLAEVQVFLVMAIIGV